MNRTLSFVFLGCSVGLTPLAFAIAPSGCGSSSKGSTGSLDSGTDGASTDAGDAGADHASGDASDGSTVQKDGGDSGSSEGGCSGSVALTYNAATDRVPHMATPPTLGPAGSIVKDPTYGTQVVRITDETTMTTNLSYRVANEFWGNDWNTDATLFYIQDSSGAFLLYKFNPKTLAATPLTDSTGAPLKMPLMPGGFSRTDPNIFYGLTAGQIAQYDFSTEATTDIVALTTIVPDETGNALGVEAGENGLLAAVFGGPEQDKMPYIATYDPTTKTSHVVDVAMSTLDGKPLGTKIGGGLHVFQMDVSGQFLAFEVAGGSSTNWVWDTSTNTITSVPSWGTVGSGAWVSKAAAGSYAWDLQTFADPTKSTSLITPAAPVDNMASASLDWKNATPAALAPLIVETMRQPGDTSPWQAWDEEVIAVRTDGVLIPGEGGTSETEVWRFAHTFNTYTGTIYSDAYYYLFIPRVSQNGWFVVFDSNWNSSLGTDSMGNTRTDAFVVALPNPCGP
jgi:hypothetical protein